TLVLLVLASRHCPLFYSLLFFHVTATTDIYTLSLHDALPISVRAGRRGGGAGSGRAAPDADGAGAGGGTAVAVDPDHHHVPVAEDRKSTRLNSSHVKISYAVFCLKKKKKNRKSSEIIIRHQIQ